MGRMDFIIIATTISFATAAWTSAAGNCYSDKDQTVNDDRPQQFAQKQQPKPDHERRIREQRNQLRQIQEQQNRERQNLEQHHLRRNIRQEQEQEQEMRAFDRRLLQAGIDFPGSDLTSPISSAKWSDDMRNDSVEFVRPKPLGAQLQVQRIAFEEWLDDDRKNLIRDLLKETISPDDLIGIVDEYQEYADQLREFMNSPSDARPQQAGFDAIFTQELRGMARKLLDARLTEGEVVDEIIGEFEACRSFRSRLQEEVGRIAAEAKVPEEELLSDGFESALAGSNLGSGSSALDDLPPASKARQAKTWNELSKEWDRRVHEGLLYDQECQICFEPATLRCAKCKKGYRCDNSGCRKGEPGASKQSVKLAKQCQTCMHENAGWEQFSPFVGMYENLDGDAVAIQRARDALEPYADIKDPHVKRLSGRLLAILESLKDEAS